MAEMATSDRLETAGWSSTPWGWWINPHSHRGESEVEALKQLDLEEDEVKHLEATEEV